MTTENTNHPEGSWESELENLKAVNGAMYFGTVEEPCTGECCPNQQTYEEALSELKDFIKQHGDKRYEEGVRAALEVVSKKNAPYRAPSENATLSEAEKAIQALIPNKGSV